MPTSIDTFMKIASFDQKKLLFKMVEVGEKEAKATKVLNEKLAPFEKIYNNTNTMKDGQYSKIIKEDTEDHALIATREERDFLKNIRNQMKELYIKAVKMGMKDLGIIQRNYEHYIGSPIPSQNSTN